MDLRKISTNERFTRLVTIKPMPPQKNFAMWLCKCDCGKEVKIRAAHLRNGANKSCGCLLAEVKQTRFREYSAKMKRAPGEASAHALFINYRRTALEKSLVFELSEKEFLQMTSKDCYYCGEPPSQKKLSTKMSNGAYTYNGVDRLNSDIGYTQANTAPCCKNCNWSKRTLTVDEFKAHILKLAVRIQEGAW